MEQRLSVIIEADVKRFNQALSQAEKNLKNAENIMRRSAGEVNRLEAALAKLSNQYKRGAISEKSFQAQAEKVSKSLLEQRKIVQNSQSEIARLGSSIKAIETSRAATQTGRLGGSMKKLTGNVRGANGVAIEFNRIIQDAPFGLMGIGNNLQQLAGNFSNVSRAAGGTKKAIVASLSALITPANLALLAISAITAGFTAYQMGAFDFAKKTKDATKEAEKFAEELENFKKSLDGVAQSQLKGAQAAQQELAELKALQSQAANTALSTEQRLEAVKELQSRYPKYLGNLSQEQILNGNLGDSLERLTTNLLESAKARAAVSRIAENSSKALDFEIRANERVNDIIELQNKLEAERIKLKSITGTQAQAGAQIEQLKVIQEIQNIEGQIDKLRGEQVRDIEEIGNLNAENLKLQDKFSASIKAGGSLIKDATSEAKNLSEAFKGVNVDVGSIDFQGLSNRIKQAYQNAATELQADGGVIDIPVNVEIPTSEYDQKIIDANDAIIAKTKQMEAVVSQTGIQISNSFANAFAQGLDSGENFFDSIAKGMKALLKQLAAQLAAAAFLKILAGITTGGVSTAFGAALDSNPFGGFFASGGPVSAGKSYVVGEQGPEMFIPKTSGTIVPNHQMAASAASSGGGSMTVNVVGKIMNDAIVLSNQRGQRTNNRYYGIND